MSNDKFEASQQSNNPQPNEGLKLDYETCNQLRFNFRDSVHKYALMYIVFISAYLTYGKFVLNPDSKDTPNGQTLNVNMHVIADPNTPINVQVAKESNAQGKQSTTNKPDKLNKPYSYFFSFIGIIFGGALSLSCHVGLRMYCRNRSLSVCAIRSQQILRHQHNFHTSLLSGLKVFTHQKYHASIPHGISNGEFQIVILLCLLSIVPLFLSYPFYDMYFSKLRIILFPDMAIWIWALILGVYIFFCAYTLENTFGHLSEADAITNTNRIPIFPKSWGSDGHDPGYRIFRKSYQKTFYWGYGILTILILIIYFWDSIFINHIILSLISFSLIFLLASMPILIKLIRKKRIIKNKYKTIRYSLYVGGIIIYDIILIAIMFYKGEQRPFLSSIIWLWKSLAIVLIIRTIYFIFYKIARFYRGDAILQSQAILSAGDKYGIWKNNTDKFNVVAKDYALDNLGYRVFKESCFTYDKCFNLEDCITPGDLYKRLETYENPLPPLAPKKRLKPFYKTLFAIYPKIGRIFYDCWNFKKIKDDFFMEYNNAKIAVFFPNWLGDCIMTRGAIKKVSGFYPEYTFIPIISEKNNKIIIYSKNEALVYPGLLSTAFKHAKLKLIINWLRNIFRCRKLIIDFDKESFRAAFLITKNEYLAHLMKCPTLFYREAEQRLNSQKMHCVDLIVEFMESNLNKMGISRNASYQPIETDYFFNYSEDKSSSNEIKIGIFPCSSNHNKYKGLSYTQTIVLVQMLKTAYNDKVQIIMFKNKKHDKYNRHIKNAFLEKEVVFMDDFINGFQSLSYVITIDTGTLHLAQFYNIPSTGIYGPTNPDKTGPYPLSMYNKTNKHNIVQIDISPNPDITVDKSIILSENLIIKDVFPLIYNHMNKMLKID